MNFCCNYGKELIYSNIYGKYSKTRVPTVGRI